MDACKYSRQAGADSPHNEKGEVTQLSGGKPDPTYSQPVSH